MQFIRSFHSGPPVCSESISRPEIVRWRPLRLGRETLNGVEVPANHAVDPQQLLNE
jgi:hypothetical protein